MAANSEQRPGSGRASVRAKGAEPAAPAADTPPPTPLALFATGGGGLVVLSVDAELVATVQGAAGNQFPVTVVATWDQLEAAIAAGQCGVALLDADVLGRRLHARIGALERYSSQLVLLVAADRSVAQGLMGLLAENKLHRLLIKPSAPGITRLLIESAVNRYLRLRAAAPVESAIEHVQEMRWAAAPNNARIPLWVLATAAAALLGGAVLVVGVAPRWFSPAPATVAAPEPRDPPAPAGAAAVEQSSLDALLEQADQALREGRLAEPAGDNALDYCLALLAADPTHEAGRAKLGAVLDALFAVAESALLADSHEAAARALGHARRADPTSSRLAFLEAQLERARAAPPPRNSAAAVGAPDTARAQLASELVTSARKALASTDADAAAVIVAEARRFGAEPAVLASLEAELAAARVRQRNANWLALFESRLLAGNLFAPAGDSAHDYLSRLRDAAPRTAGLDAAWGKLRAAASAQATTALAARDWSGAESLLERLETLPEGNAAAAELRAELERGRLQEGYLATAAPASELTLVERAAPIYPEDAERRGVEGWVEVEFVVDAAGRPRDLSVVGADPGDRFDEAALAAIRQYRYRPFERDGQVFERLVRLRIRFALQ